MAMRKVGGTRKKSAKKKTSHRRKSRRMSGVGDIGGIVMKGVGLGAGALAGRELNKIVIGFVPTLSPLLSGVIQFGVGAFIPKFIKGPFVQNMADGLMANGLMVAAVSAVPALNGVMGSINGNMAAYRINRVNGTGNLPVVTGRVNGTGNLPVVTGPQTRISNTVVPRPMMASVRTLSY